MSPCSRRERPPLLPRFELDASGQPALARRLRSLGVTVEDLVGVCVERSPAMIVAVFGILKAGAAYVPLDPTYPRQRLAYMVEDARLAVLVTEERLRGCLPETPETPEPPAATARLLFLDAEGRRSAPARKPPGAACPPRLRRPRSTGLHVIYTSGSTGRPKGVMIHHQGWSNLAEAQRRRFGVGPGDRVLQFASLSFDASAWEIAMTLSAGATLLLGPRERRRTLGGGAWPLRCYGMQTYGTSCRRPSSRR